MSLLITFLLGIFFLIGAAVIRLAKNSEWIEQLSVSLAFGSMTALVVLELLPDIINEFAREHTTISLVAIILGLVGLKALDLFIPDHDGHLETATKDHHDNMVHIGIISAIAIILHNTVEGMTVYSVTLESLRQGALLSLGVGLHNIPMGMLIYASLEKERRSKRYLVMSLASLSTFFGGLLMTLISPWLNEILVGFLISAALGMILYIIFFELIPDLLRRKHWGLSVAGIVCGVLILMVGTLLE
ncbi:MAG: ZIP family metal transporter [Lachnospiraceae bacterium]|nr:ZIP family metal transporter [Lachnospiraceae bacterium]